MSTSSPASSTRPRQSPFGRLLRYHRNNLRMSQLQLANEAEVSSRHLSFMENGKSSPSREMVVQLGAAMELPSRDVNALLKAAGFAPLYRETDLDAPELAPFKDALLFMLDRQAPYPAVLIDRYWNLLRTNTAAQRMMLWLFDGPPPMAGSGQAPNSLRWLFDPNAMKPYVANWEELAQHLIQRVHRDVLGEHDQHMQALLAALLASPGVPANWRRPDLSRPPAPLVPMVLEKNGITMRFFTTITTLGTPQDITLQEIRLEAFFPADEATDRLIKEGWTG